MHRHSGEVPEDAFSADVARFSHYLHDAGADFLVLDHEDGGARVRFVGRFQGNDVVWDCRFVTLREESRRLAAADGAAVGRGLRSFIEIGTPGATGLPISVGLDLERIDRPAILKMILMVRNYKRLKTGRHEFGVSVAR